MRSCFSRQFIGNSSVINEPFKILSVTLLCHYIYISPLPLYTVSLPFAIIYLPLPPFAIIIYPSFAIIYLPFVIIYFPLPPFAIIIYPLYMSPISLLCHNIFI